MSRTDLPSEKASNFQARLRETVQTLLGTRGDKLDRALTLRDMIESKLFELRPGAVVGSGAAPLQPGTAWPDNTPAPYAQDLTPPPAPEGVTAITSGNSIQVTVNPQTYRQGNGPGTVTVYGAKYLAGGALPTFSDAAILDEFPGDVHAFQVDPGSLYRIWVKSVSRDGVPSSPAGGTNGIAPSPGLLDDVSIAALAVSRLRSGSVTVGQFIQASNYVPGTNGWRINGDGTAEFSGVVVRGAVYATAGQIGGITIASNAVRAGQTAYNTGSGFHLGSDGRLSLGNSTGNRLTWDGTNISVVGGGTFSGALSAATGTFAGALSAATGTFSGSLSAATGTFSGALNAATGTFSGSMTASAVNAVNTINLAGQAVTIPVGAYSSGQTPVGSYAQTATIVSTGAPIVISASVVISNNQENITWSLRRNGVVIYQGPNIFNPNPLAVAFTVIDTPGAGSHTYQLGASDSSYNRALVLLEVKK